MKLQLMIPRLLQFALWGLLTSATLTLSAAPQDRAALKVVYPTLSSQFPISQHLTVNHGLQTNDVNCILQDQEGIMWFGTSNGLFCFDGIQLKNPWNTLQTYIGITAMVEDRHHEIWLGTDAGLFLYDKIKQSVEFFHHPTASGDSICHTVTMLQQDALGNIWIGTENNQLYQYNPERDLLTTIIDKGQTASPQRISALYVDHDLQVWVVIGNTHLYKAKYSSDQQVPVWENFEEVVFLDEENRRPAISTLFQDSNHDYWLGANTGIYRLSQEEAAKGIANLTIKRPLPKEMKRRPVFVSGIAEKDNQIYATTNHGLMVFSIETQEAIWYIPDFSRPGTMNDITLSDVYVDQEDGLWISTRYGGVNYQSPNIGKFSSHININTQLGGHVVSGISEDANGNIWLAIEDGGYCLWNRKTNVVTHFTRDSRHPLRPSTDTALSIFAYQNKIYLGTWGAGLDIFDFERQQRINLNKRNSYPDPLPNAIYCFKTGRDGHLLLGTHKGLFKLNVDNQETHRIPTGIEGPVQCITQDQFNNLWVGTYREGLHKYSYTEKQWQEVALPATETAISIQNIRALGTLGSFIYIGTHGHGLWAYDLNSKNFSEIVPQTLSNKIIYSILPEKDVLWITTNQGLFSYNVITHRVKQYTELDGIRSNQFKENAGYITSKGDIIVGGVNGINYFKSAELKTNDFAPQALLTGFYISNQLVDIHTPDSPLKQPINFTEQLELNEKYNSIAFQFSSSSYSHTNKYEYQLEPLDKQWQKTDNNLVSYTFLPPGQYTFKVRTSNGEGIWSTPKSVALTIHPYWWRSLPMKILYLLTLIVLVTIGIIRYHRKKQEEMRLFHLKKDQEVYRSKMEFFTYMVHEIRTPLTLITGPLSNIMHHHGDLEEVRPDLQMIERNSQRLLQLVNQLMDFRKVEEKSYTVQLAPTEIKDLTMSITKNFVDFKLHNAPRGIQFSCDFPQQACWAIVDREAFTKVLSNLLSNALKFTKDQIRVQLSPTADQRYWELTVSDNGKGIAPEEQQAIFGSFYQVRQDLPNDYVGTGIGLAVVHRLTTLMKGTISVESQLNQGASFSLKLPATTVPVAEEACAPCTPPTDSQNFSSEEQESHTPQLLIVEDNDDMRTFISEIFKEQYEVVACGNGKEALEHTAQKEFDLVITDLMMPVMDGLTLCQQLKNGKDTSHIPVVILTAKADDQSQKEGYDSAADLYVVKPFSKEILLSQIRSLLLNRQKLHTQFYTVPETNAEVLCLNNTDKEFLDKLNEEIEAELDNSELLVDDFAKEFGMGRCVFYKKVKAITGLTPNEYIRTYRLKKAAALLRNGEKRINEVCYMVGFSSHSYFTKRFVDQFGVSPSDYIKNFGKGGEKVEG